MFLKPNSIRNILSYFRLVLSHLGFKPRTGCSRKGREGYIFLLRYHTDILLQHRAYNAYLFMHPDDSNGMNSAVIEPGAVGAQTHITLTCPCCYYQFSCETLHIKYYTYFLSILYILCLMIPLLNYNNASISTTLYEREFHSILFK